MDTAAVPVFDYDHDLEIVVGADKQSSQVTLCVSLDDHVVSNPCHKQLSSFQSIRRPESRHYSTS